MSDEPAEDSDPSSDADETSPAGSTDPEHPDDAPDDSSDAERSDPDEQLSDEAPDRSQPVEPPSGADATDADAADATTDSETDGANDDATDRDDAEASAATSPDEGDGTDAGTDDGADAIDDGVDDADHEDATDSRADDDGAGPGSARARMGSQPPPQPTNRDERDSQQDSEASDRAADEPGAADETTEAAPTHDPPGTPDDRPGADSDDAPAAPYDSDEAEGPAGTRGSGPRPTAHARGAAKSPASADASAETSGTTSSGDSGGSSGGILSGGIGGSAPPDDEEMPLTEHIEEMLTRLGIVVVVAAFATLAAFPIANDLIIHMWYDVHYGTVEACKASPQSGNCVAPHVYGPLELVLTRIRVAGLAGLLVALPLAIYQTYRFMRPGLYPHERRYFLAAVPFSLVLAIVGMVFAYFVLLPLLFAYFISYTQGTADLAFQLAETMNIILLMMGMLAIVFQIPLLIMLAIMMGITTRQWLERRRLYFWGLFVGVAFIFGPDPTGMAPFLLTATMVVLFEGTLLLLRWTGR